MSPVPILRKISVGNVCVELCGQLLGHLFRPERRTFDIHTVKNAIGTFWAEQHDPLGGRAARPNHQPQEGIDTTQWKVFSAIRCV